MKKLFHTNEIRIRSYEILSTVYAIEKVKIYNHYEKLKSVVLFFISARLIVINILNRKINRD